MNSNTSTQKHGKGKFLVPTVFAPFPWNVLQMNDISSPLICTDLCGQRHGYTNLGDSENQWWVGGGCKKPTLQWLKAQGDTVLNFFVGGSLDGMAYATSTLLAETSLHSLITEYRFTNEVRKSQATGRIARVWIHIPPAEPGSVTHNRNTNPEGVSTMTEQTTQESQAPEQAPVDTSGLAEARGALKVSRQKVADASGGQLTVAKVWRLEQGANKRTTQAEVDAYRAALETLQAQAPAAGDAESGDSNPS